MKAVEFQASVNPDHTLRVPPETASLLPVGKPVRVLLLIPEDDAEEWERFAAAEFARGYGDSDSIYDH